MNDVIEGRQRRHYPVLMIARIHVRCYIVSVGALLIAAAAPAFAQSSRPATSAPAATAPAAAYAPFNLDAAGPAWLLEHFRFPNEWATKAAEAKSDPRGFDAVVRAYFRARPAIGPLPNQGIRNNKNTIADYQAGALQLGSNKDVPFGRPMQWSNRDAGENFQAELHSLRFLTNFQDEYEKISNREYFDVLDEVLLDWMMKNSRVGANVPARAWAEGTVTKRTMVLANLAPRLAAVEPPGRVSIVALLALLHYQAGFISRTETYRVSGNHGLRQDLALLTMSAIFPEFNDAETWRELALKRLREKQVTPGFTREGVWKEHSPRYHYYVVSMLRQIEDIAALNGSSAELEFLHELLQKSNKYLAHVLTPSGDFPPVGDSAEEEMGIDNADDPELLYTITQGRRGRPSEELDGFYPQAGEAIFRDTWGSPDRPANQAFYVHMHASFHPGSGHRHQDDLSFIVNGLGRWWILESGKYAYDKGDFRNHVRSAQAHNSITYNGEALANSDTGKKGRAVSMGKTAVATPALAAVRAWTTRFKPDGVRAERTLVFLRQRQTIVLIDRLTAPGEGPWQSYLHLAPDAECTTGDSGVTVTVPTHATMRMDIVTEGDTLALMRVVKGQKDPILGWYSPEYGEIVPTPVIIMERRGKDVLTATVIRIGEASKPPPNGLKSTVNGTEYHVSWKEGDATTTLNVASKPAFSVTMN